MYVEGISAAVDAGRWDKLEPDAVIDGFDHAFLLRARGDLLIGRMWSSADGKGRTKYPMVVVAQVTGAPMEWALPTVMAELEALKARCQATTAASDVIVALDQARASLRAQAASRQAARTETVIPATFAGDVAASPALGPDRQGLLRVLYQIGRELTDYALGTQPGTRIGRIEESRTHHLRLPAVVVKTGSGGSDKGKGSDAAARLLTAARLLLTKLEPYAPMLFIAPLSRDFVDAIVGDPTGAQLFCLRADRKAIPLTTEIPYTIDAAFARDALAWIDAQRAAPDREVLAAPPRKAGASAGRFHAPVAPFLLALAAGLGALAPAPARAATAPPVQTQAQAQPAAQPPSQAPRIRYNAMLRELRARVMAPGITDDAAGEAARSFLARARALPGGIAYLAGVAPVLTRIDEALEGRATGVAPETLKLGPASTGLYVGAADERRGAVHFTPVKGVDLPELVFVPVTLPAPGGGPGRLSYVSTTEVSVGAFSVIVGAQGSRADLDKLLSQFDPITDPRHGPRSWEWGTAPHRPVVPARTWFVRRGRAVEAYAPGHAPPPPDLATPMQYVAPAAALYAARLFGCRLPTPAEWQTLSAAANQPTDTPAVPNRRDTTWANHAAFVRDQRAQGVEIPEPDAGMFIPPDAPAGSGSEVVTQDDGVLWLAPVGPADSGVQHLVGNVAEFVLDAPDDVLPAGRPAAVTEFITKHAAALKVIGGSALSPAGWDVGTPRATVLGEALEGYADVGFRIAFSGGDVRAQTLTSRLRAILDPLPLLPER